MIKSKLVQTINGKKHRPGDVVTNLPKYKHKEYINLGLVYEVQEKKETKKVDAK